MPIKKINSIGLPYHGIVVDHRLTLPNGPTIDYPILTSGDTQLVAIPNYPSVNRNSEQQAFDSLHGLEWRNYAIVADNHLGAANLGLDWLLYIDDNQVVWYMKLGYQVYGNQCVMSCTLQSVFGRFNPRYKTVSRTLTKKETQFNYPGKLKPLNRFTFERKPDGNEVLIHVYAKFEGENTIEFPEEMSLYEVWKIELNGNGLLSFDESLGSGITATMTKHLSYEAIQNSYIRNIPRREKRFRLGKVNIQGRYDPKPVEPPECASNTYHETFDLTLIPEGDDFIPFRHDQNTYLQSDWHGPEEIKKATLRILYDKEGIAHTLGSQRVTKRQNKLYQTFSGHGTGTQGPINYFFNGFSCVVNGYGPGLIEHYDGLQIVKAHFRIVHEASMLLDSQVVNKVILAGEVTQIAETVVHQPTINSVNVCVEMNGNVIRNVTTKGWGSNSVMEDPFSDMCEGENSAAAFSRPNIGFLSNNILVSVSKNIKWSLLENKITNKILVYAGVNGIINKADQFSSKVNRNGSFNPISSNVALFNDGTQCWV